MLDRVLFPEKHVVLTQEAYDILMAEIRGLKEQLNLIDRHATMMGVELYEMEERLMDRFYGTQA